MTQNELRCTICGRETAPQACPECGGRMEIVRRRYSLPVWVVLFLLFFVLGPLAFGILWRNERFTRNAKWALTIIVTIYSAIIIYLIWSLLGQLGDSIDRAFNQFQF